MIAKKGDCIRALRGQLQTLAAHFALIAIAHDCTGAPAGGVHFTLTPSNGAAPFYVQGQVVSPTPTETSNPGGLAAGGFVNVPADAELSLGAEVVETSLQYVPQTVFVRSSGLSYVWTGPAPPRNVSGARQHER